MQMSSASAFQRRIETDTLSSSLRSHSNGAYSAGMRSALSALASDGISYLEILGPSGGKVHAELSGVETAVSLAELIDRHIAAQLATADAVRAWDKRRAAGEVRNVTYAKRLLGVAREEEAGWLAIVDYRPRSNRESRLKLTYMAAYLIATRGTLNTSAISSVPEASRDGPGGVSISWVSIFYTDCQWRGGRHAIAVADPLTGENEHGNTPV